jgi:hypothetical protein
LAIRGASFADPFGQFCEGAIERRSISCVDRLQQIARKFERNRRNLSVDLATRCGKEQERFPQVGSVGTTSD